MDIEMVAADILLYVIIVLGVGVIGFITFEILDICFTGNNTASGVVKSAVYYEETTNLMPVGHALMPMHIPAKWVMTVEIDGVGVGTYSLNQKINVGTKVKVDYSHTRFTKSISINNIS